MISFLRILIFVSLTVYSHIHYSLKNNSKEQWYDDFNQCILRFSFNKTFFEEAVTYCNQTVNHNTHFNRLAHEEYCMVGENGCNNDLHFRGNIFIEESNNSNYFPSQKPLMEIMKKMSSASKNCKKKVCPFGHLMFFGDSVTLSLFDAFICEIYRENKFIKLESKNLVIHKLPHGFEHGFDKDYIFSKIENKANKNDLIKFKTSFHFIIPNITIFSQIFSRNIEIALKETDYIALVVNAGLWYQAYEKDFYTNEMEKLLKYLYNLEKNINQRSTHKNNNKKTIKIFWRETSAQHFPKFGYFEKNEFLSLNYSIYNCLPHNNKNKTITSNWRNDIIKQIIKINNYENKIKIIPFFDSTVPLWNHHPYFNKNKFPDCTHFCWTPFTYFPIFNFLANSI
jgi:hypothetical protein